MDGSYSIRLKPFSAVKNNFPSTLLTSVEALAKSERAYLVKGVFEFKRHSVCWKCNKVITNEKSIHFGLGPDCAKLLGVPWDSSKEDLEQWKLENMSFEGWIEKSHIDKILLDFDEVEELPCSVIDKTHDIKIDQMLHINLNDGQTIRVTTNPDRINTHFYGELKGIHKSHKWDVGTKTNIFFLCSEVANGLVKLADRWRLQIKSVPEGEFEKLLSEDDLFQGQMTVFVAKPKTLSVKTNPQWISYDFTTRCKEIYGRKWNAKEKSDELPATIESIDALHKIAEDFKLKIVVEDSAQELVDEAEALRDATSKLVEDDSIDFGIVNFEPRSYQKQAIVRMAELLELDLRC